MDIDFQKKVLRELGDIKKYLELIYKEREILEDHQSSLKAVGEKIVQQGVHMENKMDDVKSTVKQSQFAVEEKVDEVKEDVVKGITG